MATSVLSCTPSFHVCGVHVTVLSCVKVVRHYHGHLSAVLHSIIPCMWFSCDCVYLVVVRFHACDVCFVKVVRPILGYLSCKSTIQVANPVCTPFLIYSV